MAEISYNSVFDGISLALHTAYPDRAIHASGVKQGLIRGGFVVALVSAGHTHRLGRRYLRDPVFDVIYFPEADGELHTGECLTVANAVTLLLGSITTPEGDIIHGDVRDWTITDGVLHIPVQYAHHIYLTEDSDVMEELDFEQEG